MAWRVWSKLLLGHKWMLVLWSLLLLSLAALLTTLALPLPAPHPDGERWPSRALSSAHELKPRDGASQQIPGSALRRPSTSFFLQSNQGPTWNSNHGEGRNSKNVGGDKSLVRSRRDQNRHKSLKGRGGGARQFTGHASPPRPRFTTNGKRPKRRIKPADHSEEAYAQVEKQKYTRNRKIKAVHGNTTSLKHAVQEEGKRTDKNNERHKTYFGEGGTQKVSETNEHFRQDGQNKCASFKPERSSGGGRIRASADRREAPWFSEDDVQKMKLLADGEPVAKSRVPAHGQVLQVALEMPDQKQTLKRTAQDIPTPSQTDRCHRGECSLVKRTDDWFEVFAFHLDRVLGLNRTLPAVLRSFHSEILPYRYTRRGPRPAVWWDPDIQHLQDSDNDQNSVPLSYAQYQRMLKARCGINTGINKAPCMGVHHSEWSRLALFDFLLQVNDRLDRYCCGFRPDPTDVCVENLLQSKCGSTKDLQLVHILVRKADPSRLVFIDNAGRPQQPLDNLNFRLLQGIDRFPEKAMSVLRSGCLESLLLRSLYVDREFWDVRGGAGGLRALIRTVEQRGQSLLQHFRDEQLPSYTDL